MYISSKTGLMAAGKVGRDAETRIVGDKQSLKLTFSIAVGKESDGETTKWLNCEAWETMARYVEGLDIQKGDPVTVWGYLRTNEYNGKVYTNLVVEGIMSFSGRQMNNVHVGTTPPINEVAFDDVDDEELPF